MTTLSASVIRKWSEAGLFRQVDLGISIEDANRLAERCWIEILAGKSVSSAIADPKNRPDVLHALSRLLQDSTAAASREGLSATAALYEFTSDEFRPLVRSDEKNVLCAEFAYVAWRCCRRLALWPEAHYWESACEQHTVAQDDAREYLRLSARDRAWMLPKFLVDRATLLVACRQLRRQINQEPNEGLFLATAIYRWVSGSWEGPGVEERAFFAGESAWLVGNGLRIAGLFAEAGTWLDASAQWFSKTEDPTPLLARVELSVASALYNRQELEESRAQLPRLVKIFSKYRMEDALHKCQLLEGMALKDLGHRTEAIATLTPLVDGSSPPRDPLVHGLGWAQLGEAFAGNGAFEDASKCFANAIPLIEEARAPWATADCKAMLGEVLRDQGKLEEAIALYKSAIQMNLTIGLVGRTAYLRVVLAETLMMSGRDDEGAAEILAALPTLERERVGPTVTAALRLLHESMRRQKADPEAVRRLRLELQRMREGNNS